MPIGALIGWLIAQIITSQFIINNLLQQNASATKDETKRVTAMTVCWMHLLKFTGIGALVGTLIELIVR
jgi:hypothetical protein